MPDSRQNAMPDRARKIRPGSRLQNRETGQPARVMKIAEGWAMLRPTSAQPLLISMREIYQKYEVTKW